jgi:hypothetical protein
LETLLEAGADFLPFPEVVVDGGPRPGLRGNVGEGIGEVAADPAAGGARLFPDVVGDFTEDLVNLGELKADFKGDLGGGPVLMAVGRGFDSSALMGFTYFPSPTFAGIDSSDFWGVSSCLTEIFSKLAEGRRMGAYFVGAG